MTGLLRSVWTAPAAIPAPPRRVWWDGPLVVTAGALAVLEAMLRTDLAQPLLLALFALAAAPTLLWRRSRPLLMLLLSFVVLTPPALLLGDSAVSTSAVGILLLSAVFRWGDGRALVIGTGFVLVNLAVSALTGTPLGELAAQAAFAAAVIGLGLAVRFAARARLRELDGARLLERETLARDLHDTVAHHVSAIAIRAQAGLAVAEVRPDAALDALRVIEAEASTTLAEMRSIVRVLRVGEASDRSIDRAPRRTLADIRGLATDEPSPRVVVRVTGDADSIPPTVAAAVYRMAQESVTNARRHARGASTIDVRVAADADGVRLRVTDDGESGPAAPPGYGITGMVERAALLGGTCQAEPAADGGWVVTATLPRVGWSR